MRKRKSTKKAAGWSLNEDWLAVGLAFLLILLAAIGILGQNGLSISF
jgi:hypothetical protein